MRRTPPSEWRDHLKPTAEACDPLAFCEALMADRVARNALPFEWFKYLGRVIDPTTPWKQERRSAALYHNRLRAALRDALDTIDACGSINVEKARALLAKGDK